MSTDQVPRFPGLVGYPALAEGLAGLGLRHAADLLADPAVPYGAEVDAMGLARFRVLDGVWLAAPGDEWLRVDAVAVQRARARSTARFGEAAALADGLLDRLAGALGEDPGLLRHLLLYQLVAHAARRVGGTTRDLLLGLGVHSAEVDAIARLADAGPRLPADALAAVEELADVVAAGRIHRAGELLRRIPPGPGDWRLDRVRDEVEGRLGRADLHIDHADRLLGEQRFDEAAENYLSAVLAAPDEPRLRDRLVSLAIRVADDEESPGVRATPMDDGIEIRHEAIADGIDEHVDCELLRLDCAFGTTTTIADGHEFDAPFIDTGVCFGQEVRYVALPMSGGLLRGAASTSARIRYAPDVDEATLRCTPQGVRLSWRRPGRVVSVRLQRERDGIESGGVPVTVDARGASALDHDVEPGAYVYRIRCGYLGSPDSPSSGVVWSAGMTLRTTVRPWPTAVDRLASELSAEHSFSVRLDWQPPSVGTARLVLWPFGPREPGEDVSDLIRGLPSEQDVEEVGGRGGTAVLAGRPGETLRAMVVSVLGDLAVAGASAFVQVIPAPRNLTVVRTGNAAEALVQFSWPEPAVLVAVRWEQAGAAQRETLARSEYPPGGLRIPVGPGGCLVTVEPLGRPDAQVFRTTASADLPALPPSAVSAVAIPLWRRATRRVLTVLSQLLGRRAGRRVP